MKNTAYIFFIVSGNKLIADQDGAEIILTVLEKDIALKNTDSASFLLEMATGLLLNFLVFYKEIHTNQVINKVSESLSDNLIFVYGFCSTVITLQNSYGCHQRFKSRCIQR